MTALKEESGYTRLFAMTSIVVILVANLITLVNSFPMAEVRAGDTDDQANGGDLTGLSIAEIARLRNYISEEHYVTTSDGYILQVTRILNPLIKDYSKKLPLLLLHSLLSHGSIFVTESANARPRDYSRMKAAQMSQEELQVLLANDPATRSMAFLASNFGQEVWILNRRGSPGSRGHVRGDSNRSGSYTPEQARGVLKAMRNIAGDIKRKMENVFNNLTGFEPSVEALDDDSLFTSYTFDPNYWNFSLDEEARYDVPEVIDYVLKVTGHKQLNTVGHSAGGALVLMSLATFPRLNRKIAKPALWAPALYLDVDISNRVVYALQAALSPIVRKLTSPFFPEPLNKLLRTLAATICSTRLTSRMFCSPIFNLLIGSGGDEQYITSGFFNLVPASTSTHEFDHFYQVMTVGKGKMHTYDFGSASINLAKYGSQSPILYDVSRISNKNMSFWFGNTDTLVSPENRFRLYQDLAVPYTANFIDGPGISFNHLEFFTHENVANLLNIPTLRAIDS